MRPISPTGFQFLRQWSYCHESGFKGCKAALLPTVKGEELSLNTGRAHWQYRKWKVTFKSWLWLVMSKSCVMSIRLLSVWTWKTGLCLGGSFLRWNGSSSPCKDYIQQLLIKPVSWYHQHNLPWFS